METQLSDAVVLLEDSISSLMGFDVAQKPRRDVDSLGIENERLKLELNKMRLRLLEVERAADTDPLVPIYNRRAFVREVEKAKTIMARYDILSSVIFFDLNGFKAINDRYGHSIGDELLRKVAGALNDNVRSCDLVARLGGDEFGVLLFKSSGEDARAKAAALSNYIAQQSVDLPTSKISVTSAWGVSSCEAEESAEQILARADRAMYEAKRENSVDLG